MSDHNDDIRMTSLDIRAKAGEPSITTAQFEGSAVEMFAAMAIEWFKDGGGVNFVTMGIADKETDQRYSLVMQKENCKTPAVRIAELEAQVAALTSATKPNEVASAVGQ